MRARGAALCALLVCALAGCAGGSTQHAAITRPTIPTIRRPTPTPGSARLAITPRGFVPSRIVATAGVSVAFTNTGTSPCRLSRSSTTVLLGAVAGGATRDVRLARPGVYRFRCAGRAGRATIVVKSGS